MGAVHGVYLKYVGLSALSCIGYAYLADDSPSALIPPGIVTLAKSVLGYSAVVNGAIAIMFKLRRGMGLLGKNKETGQIPPWSYVIWFPFHLPNMLYTHIHTRTGTFKKKLAKGAIYGKVPVASEVQPGWWVGGCYSSELNRDWAAVIDLTVEFPEACFNRTKSYLLLPTWDGVPCSPDQLEEAAKFAVAASKKREGTSGILVHCAHGRGRSTTVMCACLVKAGLYPNWEDALEKGIKPGRPVCKLNSSMKAALAKWQSLYVDNKKTE